ncbi:MAG: hypothetical protein LBG79_05190 [Spirochaetaceae bacterium]|jgi:hypothetical protein|nr:hypothetical protein [Spirochaetaceae bacterium]
MNKTVNKTKKCLFKLNLCLCLFVFFVCAVSCATSGFTIKNSASWFQDGSKIERKLKAGRIIADKPGGGRSIEREISELLPLLFLEKGYLFVADEDNVDYVVEVRATERDYYVGWESKKSVSLEVVLWPANRPQDGTGSSLRIETPIASGRTVAQGTQGFASSKNTETMLRSSVNELLKSLEKINTSGEAAVYKNGASNTSRMAMRQIYEQ